MTRTRLAASSLTYVVMALTSALLCGCQPASLANGADEENGMTLRQAAEFRQNILQDISADGRLLLFYQTSAPTRSYTIPSVGGRAGQPAAADDVLRVVERGNGREVGRVKVEFFPESVQFVPGQQQVFYKEPASDKRSHVLKVWSFSAGSTETCSDAGVTNFRHAAVVEAGQVLGAVLQENGGELLVRLKLPDCTQTVAGPVSGSDAGRMTWGA